MNSEVFNKWLSLAANLGVLVGLVFLAIEIQQSNKIASASMEFSIRQNFISIQEYLSVNEGIAELLAKAKKPDVSFTPIEDEKIWSFVYVHLNHWISIELSHNQGLTSEFTFQQVKEDIASVLPYTPSLIPYWRQALDEFPSIRSLEISVAIQQQLDKIDSQRGEAGI